MPQPLGAALESFTATLNVGVLGNVWLTDGARSFLAIVDRGVERVGEFGQFVERRDRIMISKMDASGIALGDTLSADPAVYTSDEILAMPRSSWTLDAVEKDDSHLISWWVR